VESWIRTAKHKRNENRLKELKTETMLERISDYNIDWIQHDNRVKRNTIKELLIAKNRTVHEPGKIFEETTGRMPPIGLPHYFERRFARPNVPESYAGGRARYW
jgi:hypothetical protein